jgi:hypothetical protein
MLQRIQKTPVTSDTSYSPLTALNMTMFLQDGTELRWTTAKQD